MSTRLVAVMVGLGVIVGLLAGLLTGALVFRPNAVVTYEPPAVQVERDNVVETPATQPNRAPFIKMADRICEGDANALPELIAAADALYQDIDFERDRARVKTNLTLMTAAYERLGEAAGESNPAALSALKQSVATGGHVRGFAAKALGTAAAAGNLEALNMLLNHDEFNILQSSAVGALSRPASKGNADAIDYLVRVLDDPAAKPLWPMASEGLSQPATEGNEKAAAALKRYRETLPKR